MKIAEIRREFLSKEAYAVYKSCMYEPTYEKFITEAEEMLTNPRAQVFAAYESGVLAGIIAAVTDAKQVEIIGIASARPGNGIGGSLIRHIRRMHPPLPIYAQTDAEAVGFYRKCGFSIAEIHRHYPNGDAVRYSCILKQ